MASTANRVIKNTGFLYAKMGITMFISLYTTRLILNSLGASDFGIFNIVGGAIAMLGFLNAAMASATQRFMSYSEGEGDKEKQKSIFNISFVLHFFLSLIVGLALLGAGWFFFNGILNIPPDRMDAAKVVYGSLIISTMFTVMTVPYDAVMNAHENMKYYAIVGVIESLLKLSVAFACVYTSFDKLIVYGILMACIQLITLTIMRVYCHRHYEECLIAPVQYFNKKLMGEMTCFAGWNVMASSIIIISAQGVGIIVNMFFGTIVNVAQGVANQFSGQIQAVTTVMSKAISPVLTKKAGKGDMQNLIIAACTSGKVLFFTMSMLAIPAIITMDTLMGLWLKDVPQYATVFCQYLLIIALCEQVTGGLYSSILATGNIKDVMIVKSIIRIIYLPSIYVFFKFGFSPVSAYILQFLIQGVINAICINIYFAHKKAQLSYKTYLFETFAPCVIIAFVVFLLGSITSVYFSGIIKIIIVFAVCFTLIIPITYLFGLNKYEKDCVIDICKSIRNK